MILIFTSNEDQSALEVRKWLMKLKNYKPKLKS